MFGYKNKRQFAWAYGVIFVFTVIGFFVRLSKFELMTMRQNVYVYIVSLIFLSFTWEFLRYINRTLNRTFPFERHVTGRIVLQLGMGACVGLVVRLLIHYFGEPLLPFKLDELFAAVTWVMFIIFTSLINLGFFAHYFLIRWRDSQIMNERLEKEKAQVQFDNLKNQLNPHFLFNALTSLNSLIREDKDLASQFVQQLSKVYRYVLQNKESSSVSLQTELNFIQQYIALLQTRFSTALGIRIDVSAENYDRCVVPVTLQILIENAIKHNVLDHERPLFIDVFTNGDYLIVSNNLQLRSNVETSNKQGLQNMKSLYEFLTTRPVIVEQTENRFSVKIPLL